MFGIDDIITSSSTLITTIANKIAPDANVSEQGKITAALTELNNHYSYSLKELELTLAQIEVNKVEAESNSLFRGGWRPFVGWVCGVGLAYAAILDPLLRFIATVGFGYIGIFPIIDTEITMQILFGLLGLGAYRTVEKIKGFK